jgi:hypothetical protein
VEYDKVYPGIDVAYYGVGQQLEYDFILGPHADPRKIRLKVDGADRIEINAGGDLALTVGSAQILQRKPVVYQDTAGGRKRVEARYVDLGRSRVGFEIAGYDPASSLVIDPVLVFSTYFGGSGGDSAVGTALDSSGNVYISGETTSNALPGTRLGQAFNGGGSAAFVAKISPSGTLISSTYIGGSNDEAIAVAVAVDGSGDMYLSGGTTSATFPTSSPLQATMGGGGLDAFVLELNSSGTGFVFSTFLGGSSKDIAQAIALDGSGNVYVTGFTESSNFPTLNATQPKFTGSLEAFAAKIVPGGSAFLYSTYFGGGADFNNGMTVDASGDMYLYGDTASTSFPVLNAIQPTFCGWAPGQTVTNNHGWVAMLNSAGSPVYATYICGSIAADAVRGAAVAPNGNLFITGNTASTTFPTLNPIQAAYGGGASDAFVMELSPTGALLYSTYVGGNGQDVAQGLQLDALNNIYIAGYTSSTNLVTLNPVQSANAGAEDAFLTKINAAGSAIVFSTYLGGRNNDQAYGMAVNALAQAYLTGQTASTNFPTLNPLQATYGGGSADVFVAAIATCGFTFSQPGLIAAAGASGNLSITTTPECGWTATSNSAWITLTPPDSGAGSGVVAYSVSANTGGTRSGTLSIGGYMVTITQTGVPVLTITKTHAGNFSQGQNGAIYTVTVSSASTGGATTSAVTVTETVPSGLTLASMSGTGWSCSSNTCGRSDVLNAGSSYPAITVTVNVAANASSPQVNQVSVSGGGAATANATDSTVIGSPLTSVGSLSFGNQNINTTSSPQSVILTNPGPGALSISSIGMAGANSGDYAQTNNCPISPSTLAANGTCTINVTFTPAAAGARSAALTITDSLAGSPQSVSLSGTGVIPVVTLSVSSLAFGNQGLNSTSAAQPITLTNTGPGALTITSVGIAGANPSDFAQTGNCPTSPATLAVNGTCTINVTFTPTAAGSRAASVTIADNGVSSPQTATLSGTGVAPTVSFSPPSVSGYVAVGTSNTAPITLTNTGSGPLLIASIAITGTNAADYSQTNNCPLSPATLAATLACTINLTFTPSAVGLRTAALSITDNGSGSPQSVNVSSYGETPAVKLSSASLSFGNQGLNTTSTAIPLTLTNSGPGSLSISSIAIAGANPGDFAQTNNCPTSPSIMAVNATCTINVTFTPTALGSRAASVTIADNGTSSPQSPALSGTGITAASGVVLSPSSLAFGNQALNTASNAQSITLTNNGPGVLNISSIAIAGANSGDFSQTNNCPINPSTLALSGTCTINVTFTPAANGNRAASLTITDNGASSPQSAALTGTGVPAPPAVSLSVSSLTFSNQTVNTASAAQSITLTNGGPGALSISSIGFTGANPGDFTQKSSCPISPYTLGANGTCTINVTFDPTAAGSRAASVTISDNGVASPQSATLSGTGIPPVPVVSLSSSSLAFGNQAINAPSAVKSITVTNKGPGSLSISSIGFAGANPSNFSETDTCTSAPSIAVNGTCTVNVTFTPTATGNLAASLTIADNGVSSPQSASLTGTGVAPTVSFSPSSITGYVAVGTSITSPIVLTNTGRGPLLISSIGLTGADASDYSQTNNCPLSPAAVAASGTCTINLTFTPAAVGLRAAAVTVTDNGAGSPQSVTINGYGETPSVKLSSASLTFGAQTVSTTSAVESITLTNSGPGSLSISSIAIAGANPGDFAQTNNCPVSPTTMAVNATCTINVTFTPTATGSRAASVTVTDNGASRPQSIPLSGTGQ